MFLAYATLWAAGLVLNRGDKAMLALTLLVGASVFVPVPHDSAAHFYTFCILVELGVALCASKLKARGSARIIEICLVLVLAHVMGYILDGFPPLSPYRIIVKILETSQLVCCAIMSPTLFSRLRNI